MEQMNKDMYWDCHVMVGLPPSGVRVSCPDAETLLRALDWAGVGHALLYHAVMAYGAPMQGNALAAKVAAASQRLHATWALLPPATHELPAGAAFFAALARADVRALWAFSSAHRYALDRLTMGSLLDEVSERQIPVLVPCSEGWGVIGRLLEDYPRLTVVAVGHGPWGDDRYFRPLYEQYERLYLDISRYELLGGISEFVRCYGAERLVYGSGYPRWSMGGPRLMLARANIGIEAQRRIAGRNLEQLLKEAAL